MKHSLPMLLAPTLLRVIVIVFFLTMTISKALCTTFTGRLL
jgi:hypothetical protein